LNYKVNSLNLARYYMLIFGIFVMALALLLPQFAYADNVLTKGSIKSFITESSKMTSMSNKMAPQEDIDAFLKKHLHKKSRFKSTMKYTIPGFPPQKNSMSLDKDEYIESIMQAPKAVTDYNNTIKIENILISDDGTKATVRTKSKETGTMKVSETQEIPIEGVSKCNQILVLEKNTIKMFSAQCVTDVEFLDF
jgi:hypothetical protein